MRVVALVCLLIPSLATAQGAAPPPPQPKPEVYFRAPADNATVDATFPVVFGLKNYGVAPAAINVARTGHFHILINVAVPAVGTVIPTDSLHRHFGGGQIETSLTLAPGTYTLRLVLADHEHKVIGPDLASAPIRVTVRAGR
ncbi:MAG TPA: DUF4399 domain-containing protein [Gemmatimonadaceae bacterium]|nr:DUF4399 domain-containing protein [Gemmatimonadaceae bacterium]